MTFILREGGITMKKSSMDHRLFCGAGVFWITLTVAAILLAFMTGQARAATVIRMGHVGFPGSLFAVTSDEFAKRANEALKGRYEVKIFHSSQLGSDKEMLKGIKIGVLEMFQPSTIMSTVDQKFGVFEMPYLFKDREQVKRVVEDPNIKEMLFDPLQQKGLRILGVWENGFRVITNNVRPIIKPQDLKGIKLRVPSGVWRVKMFRLYGANPTPLAYSEVFAALQSGVMDGQENPFAQIYGGKFYEVQKYLSLSDHVYTPSYAVISEKFWKGLPPDVQQILSKISREIGDFARMEGARMDRELLEKMKKTLKVNEVDKEAFVKASEPVYDDFTKEVKGGKELVNRVMALR
jgi:tripartite ATP-independent transporter DctP family solute receptor